MKTEFEQFVEFAEKKYGMTITKTDKKEEVLTAKKIFGPLLDILDNYEETSFTTSLNEEYKLHSCNFDNVCSISYGETLREKTTSEFFETKYSCLAV